jgi:sulfate permease, SulP family
MSFPALIRRHLPFLEWIPNYKRSDLGGDLIAGLTVTVMLIPQGMAYAMLAGLPPIVGLYASIVPLILYGLLGTSRQLAVGPVAMVSLMVAASVGAIAETGTDAYLGLAIALALVVGVMQFAMGALRLGFVVRFLSHPVISGFTSAAAIIIGLSQLKHVLGVKLHNSHFIHETLIEAGQRVADWSWSTIALSVGAVAVLMSLRKWAPRVPGALVVVAVGTLSVWAFGLESYGIKTVGAVPSGIPMPTLPSFDLEQLLALLPTALAISLVGFMESISVAKAFAARNKYKLDADQELIALGAANIGAAFFGGYPVTGGFSRTAVNAQAGARTGLASILTAVAIAIALLTITPLFAWLPNAVLAAIVIQAVIGLIDVKEVVHLWQVRRSDLAQLVVTFVATLALGIEAGIGLGVVFSLGQVIWKSALPVVAVLGRAADGPFWRDVGRDDAVRTFDEVAVLRLDARLYFANIGRLEAEIERAVAEAPRHVVLDCSGMNDIDTSALAVLVQLSQTLAGRGRSLVLAAVKPVVRAQVAQAHLLGALPCHDTVEGAVRGLIGPFDGQEPSPASRGNVIELAR